MAEAVAVSSRVVPERAKVSVQAGIWLLSEKLETLKPTVRAAVARLRRESRPTVKPPEAKKLGVTVPEDGPVRVPPV